MNKLLYTLLAILYTFIGFSQDNKYLPTSNGEIVTHTNYILSYSEEHEQAEWVAYELASSETIKIVNRSDRFKADKTVPTGSATLKDYKGSGYDRGHLAPAGDMVFSYKAMQESFYMSNMSPQAPSFNRGVWKKLESRVRLFTKMSGDIYVVTGGILSSGLPTIGSNKVSVPKYYYKILLKGEGENCKMIAFLLKNEKSSQPLTHFVVSTNEIEELTGIDFFPQLPDELEEKLESTIDVSNWRFEGSTKSSSKKSYTTTSTAVQCNGIAKSTGVQCRKRTKNSNGYCHYHQSQAAKSTVKTTKSKAYSSRCCATTKKGTQCKRKASSGSSYCWQHK